MSILKRDISVDAVILDESFTLTPSEAQRYFERKNKCPLCKKWLLYTITYEPSGRVRRIRNPKEPASLVECPRCRGRWFFFNQPVEIEFINTDRSAKQVDFDEMTLDNREGVSPLSRTRTISEEWTKTCEVEREDTQTQSAKVTASVPKGPGIEVTAEQALKERYAISEEKKVVYTEELSFVVPPGICRQVRFVFKEIWQNGIVRLSLPSAGTQAKSRETRQVEIPFRVLIDMEMDTVQKDTPASLP